MVETTKKRKKHDPWSLGFDQGFAAAIADVVRLYDQPTIALNVCRSNGYSAEDLLKIADVFDKPALRKMQEFG